MFAKMDEAQKIILTWLMHQNDLLRHGYIFYADRINGYGFLDKAKAFIHKVHKYKQYMAVSTDEQQLLNYGTDLLTVDYMPHGFRCTRS